MLDPSRAFLVAAFAIAGSPVVGAAVAQGGSPGSLVYSYDDGIPNGSIAVGAPPATMVWLQYFETPGDTLLEIQVMNGAAAGGGNGAAVGSTGGVALWRDPTSDSDPQDAVLVAQAPWTVQFKGQDLFEPVTIPPSFVSGGFFVGAWVSFGSGESPAPVDTSVPSMGRAWQAGVTSPGAFDPSTLASQYLKPILLDGVWCLRAKGEGVTYFCTAKVGLACGTPTIQAAGITSASSSSGFVVSSAPARTCKLGVLVYNVTKLASGVPFQGGTLCVAPSGARRAGPTDSGGTPGGANCDGAFAIDMNAFAAGAWAVPDCAGSPSGLPPNSPAAYLATPGQSVYCQFWGRDSVASGSFLSAGLHFVVGP